MESVYNVDSPPAKKATAMVDTTNNMSPATKKRLNKERLNSSWINDIMEKRARKLGIAYKRVKHC